MARRTTWRDDEIRVISVTPPARGLFWPLLSTITAAGLIRYGASHIGLMYQHEALLLLVLAGPCLLLVATRTWRWRSHKIHVTNQRVVVEGGVANRYRSSVELRDVIATRVDQRVYERALRRGTASLETAAGTLAVGRVRHPAALCRLIDVERSRFGTERIPFDTVFEYENPETPDYEVNPG